MCYKEEKHKYISNKLDEMLMNVPDFISDFFEGYKSAATKKCNWGYIRALLQWLIDKRFVQKDNIAEITKEDMNGITSNHIIKYLNELKSGVHGNKNTLSSICTKKNVFGAFWNYMFLNKYVNDNIIRHIPSHLYKSEVTQKEVKVPTDEQIESFICNLYDGNNNEFNIIRNLAIVKLFLGSGIRSEELINLDIDDLYLEEVRPYIMVLGKGKLEQKDKVFISNEAKCYLINYLRSRKIYMRENNFDSSALFISNDRRRISKNAITNLFKRYSDNTINPHMLRHWVGTKLYVRTKDIVLVQRQLRHASLETAARYYVSMDEDDIANAVAIL